MKKILNHRKKETNDHATPNHLNLSEPLMTRYQPYTPWISLFLFMLLLTQGAAAGTGGSSEFGSIYTLLTGWLQGMLGRILAVTFLMVGLVSGVMRGSMMGLVLGIACGLGVYTAPTVINNIVTGTLKVEAPEGSHRRREDPIKPTPDQTLGAP
jgi:conjugal transfer pilus assembly protein TraA